ncbi:hypothetical protein ABRQ07_02055 [Pectobacterium polonicum]|uniref:DUF4352 domain-containing protein n=1 Tax=Pectobacterium polonicum TaxID=2485124 RepID=A0ABV1P5H8_9GAMM|nr:hypothetical protein [Pectobacterium polonicum]MDC9817838.1 hypothetical protein [Pectobacterium polonicum]
MDASAFIALLALIVSIYSIAIAEIRNKRNARENRILQERQKELTKILLEKEIDILIVNKKADLGARAIKTRNHYAVKIFNKGKSTAYDISINVEDENPFIKSDLEDKFPYELLHPQESIDLIASANLGMQSKHKIKLFWADDANQNNTKEIYLNF